jgi:hypothetical protein
LQRSIDAFTRGGAIKSFDIAGNETTCDTICDTICVDDNANISSDAENTDPVPSGKLTASQKQILLREALNNPNAIALFNVQGNHYRALQKQRIKSL